MKKQIFLIFLFFTHSLWCQSETAPSPTPGNPAREIGKSEPVTPVSSAVPSHSETDVTSPLHPSSAPVLIEESVPDEPEEEFLFPELTGKPEETAEQLRKELEVNTQKFTLYKALQFSSVGIAGLGILLVILDAFVETGSEYPFTPVASESNPNPVAVTTAFGNLSIAGAVVAAVGAGASIGFQFPYRKYRNRQYLLQNKIQNLEKIEEAESELDNIINEITVE